MISFEIKCEQAIDIARNSAIKEAINAGADTDTIKVVYIEKIPLAYLGNALKIRVKTVGKLV